MKTSYLLAACMLITTAFVLGVMCYINQPSLQGLADLPIPQAEQPQPETPSDGTIHFEGAFAPVTFASSEK